MRSTAIALAIITLFLVSPPAPADMLTWITQPEDVNGGVIDEANLYYRLYVRDSGTADEFKMISTMDESPLDLRKAKPGCYDLYLTAVRDDTRPQIESDPSETISHCFNLPCGEAGTNGSVGACNDHGIHAAPLAPTSIEIIIRSML